MATVAEIVRDLLIFVVAMFALCIVLLVVIARLPETNPLKRVLMALSYRVGASLGAGLLAIPIEPIPGADVLYDVAVPIGLLYYWFTFFRYLYRGRRRPMARPWQRVG